jgi:hypothetical protein
MLTFSTVAFARRLNSDDAVKPQLPSTGSQRGISWWMEPEVLYGRGNIPVYGNNVGDAETKLVSASHLLNNS